MVAGAGIDHEQLWCWNAEAAGSEKHWPCVENTSHGWPGFPSECSSSSSASSADQKAALQQLFYSCSRSWTVPGKAAQNPSSSLSHLHGDTSTEPLCSRTPQGMEESCLPTTEEPHGPVHSHFSSQLYRSQAETRSEKERNLSLQQISTRLQLSQQSPHTFSMLPKVFFGVRADLGLHLLFC